MPAHPTWWLGLAPVAGAATGLLLAAAVAASLAPAASSGGPWLAPVPITGGLLGAIASAFLLAAIPEELLFRGVGLLLPAAVFHWTRSQQAAAGAAGTVLFAVLHAPLGARNATAALLVGGVYTSLTLRSGCLWPAVMAHGYYNAALLLLATAER